MTTLEKIREFKKEMEKKLESAEYWMLGSDSWKDLNECDADCDRYKKCIEYLSEMEKLFEK